MSKPLILSGYGEVLVRNGSTKEGLELLNKALELANHKPDKCIIFQREKDKAELDSKIDITWEDAHKNAKIIIQRDFPAYTQMPEHTQKKISDQIISYCINKKYTAETFEDYQLRGTPSTIVIDKEGRLRCKSVSYTHLTLPTNREV